MRSTKMTMLDDAMLLIIAGTVLVGLIGFIIVTFKGKR
ncbi:hypothetical protein NitYY0826_C0041 [Nitratiruptor sp. YY08-26]|nr:hypothetical protein NitYY0813_C0041 [Nitratiruptor sp. YY08-13]BCD65141.1 hypothetical protein NitYY0826_C0041 [Nitratiruptor sp. YY08-26]